MVGYLRWRRWLRALSWRGPALAGAVLLTLAGGYGVMFHGADRQRVAAAETSQSSRGHQGKSAGYDVQTGVTTVVSPAVRPPAPTQP